MIRRAPDPDPHVSAMLEASAVTVRLGGHEVLRDVSVAFARGAVTALIGPNGSGKSTLLRVLAGALKPEAGGVDLDGASLASMSPGVIARRLAHLPQGPVAPSELTVAELVWRGRYPYRRLLRGGSPDDLRAVAQAMTLAGVTALADRAIGTLSGGERQRAWIALALAQEPEVLLLDEPTTFLDIAHQAELLMLLRTLNEQSGLTVVIALHELSHASQLASRIVGLREGRLVLDGTAAEVLTAERISDLFGTSVRVWHDPETGAPFVAPILEAAPSRSSS